MEIVRNSALITINATLIIQLVSFLLLVFLLHRLLLRPLRATMQERADYIDALDKDVEDGEGELEELTIRLDAKKKEFFAHSTALRQKLQDESNTEAAKIVGEARSKVTKELHAEALANKAEAENIRKEFATLVANLSNEIIDKVLDRNQGRAA